MNTNLQLEPEQYLPDSQPKLGQKVVELRAIFGHIVRCFASIMADLP